MTDLRETILNRIKKGTKERKLRKASAGGKNYNTSGGYYIEYDDDETGEGADGRKRNGEEGGERGKEVEAGNNEGSDNFEKESDISSVRPQRRRRVIARAFENSSSDGDKSPDKSGKDGSKGESQVGKGKAGNGKVLDKSPRDDVDNFDSQEEDVGLDENFDRGKSLGVRPIDSEFNLDTTVEPLREEEESLLPVRDLLLSSKPGAKSKSKPPSKTISKASASPMGSGKSSRRRGSKSSLDSPASSKKGSSRRNASLLPTEASEARVGELGELIPGDIIGGSSGLGFLGSPDGVARRSAVNNTVDNMIQVNENDKRSSATMHPNAKF